MVFEKMKNIVFYTKNNLDKKMKKNNLTATQVLILEFLKENSGKEIIQKDICKYMNLKHSTIISILKRLEEKELIKKQTKYISLIEITEKGKETINRLGIKKGFIENKALAGFSDIEIKNMCNYLDRIYNNIYDENE